MCPAPGPGPGLSPSRQELAMVRTGLAVRLEAVGEVSPAAGREGFVTWLSPGAGGSAGVWEGGGTIALSSNIKSTDCDSNNSSIIK